jgi:hypothetical protein
MPHPRFGSLRTAVKGKFDSEAVYVIARVRAKQRFEVSVAVLPSRENFTSTGGLTTRWHLRLNSIDSRRVGLIRPDKRSDELRMQQYHLVPQRLDLAGTPMRAAACFKRHSAHRPQRQKRDQLVASEASIGYLAGLRVDPVRLEDLLCDIQSICRSIHLGFPFLEWT